MALEASHIRIAFDTKNTYHITDLPAYLSGTIYPDSRYITGIDRSLTHPTDKQAWTTNFEKGWLAHLRYDETQRSEIKLVLTQFDQMPDPTDGLNTWINTTAIKIIQDIEDAKSLESTNLFSQLSHLENPNNEDVEIIKKYHLLISTLYNHPKTLKPQDYEILWNAFHLSVEKIDTLIKKTIEFQNNAEMMTEIKMIYQKTLSDTIQRYPNTP